LVSSYILFRTKCLDKEIDLSYLNLFTTKFLNEKKRVNLMKKHKVPNGTVDRERAVMEDSDEARLLYEKNRFGTMLKGGIVQLALIEALYLIEKEKVKLMKGKKEVTFEDILKLAKRGDKHFWTRYCVFRDLRDRGYIIKTALKFGADFRVYDRGVKPGEDHAKWVIFPVNESDMLTWREWAAKNRVANSTKKRLLLAVVDDENDVSYWETRWLRP
jgi:tRNA-intron endonuclease, archaea type